MNDKIFSSYNFISEFNGGEFRRSSIPMELVSGWPCIKKLGRMLCMTIPYYRRVRQKDTVALYPLYCAVTLPIGNVNHLMDFTVFPFQPEWRDIDHSKPIGYFKHDAIKDVTSKRDYLALRNRFFELFDDMILAVQNQSVFQKADELSELFSKLMEPSLFPQYKRVHEKFYTYYCHL